MLLFGATVPGLHAVGSAEPVEHAEPAGHAMQSSALVIEMFSSRSVAFWCVPALHGSGADAPSGQYDPSSHGLHVFLPDSS